MPRVVSRQILPWAPPGALEAVVREKAGSSALLATQLIKAVLARASQVEYNPKMGTAQAVLEQIAADCWPRVCPWFADSDIDKALHHLGVQWPWFASRLADDPVFADRVRGDVVVRAFAAKYEPEKGTPVTFLKCLAQRLIVDVVRRQKGEYHRKNRTTRIQIEDATDQPFYDPSADLEARSVLEKLRGSVDSKAFGFALLRWGHGLSLKEVAQETGYSLSTVKKKAPQLRALLASVSATLVVVTILGAGVLLRSRPVGQNARGPGSAVVNTPHELPTTLTFDAPGTYVVELVAADDELSASHEAAACVVSAVALSPVVAITAPADGDTITSITQVIGTVHAVNLVSWSLDYRLVGEGAWTPLQQSATAVQGATLGAFDPTLLVNGLYELRLNAIDASGAQAATSTTIIVEGNQKVGNFTVSFKDLGVPVAGIPIEVIRTYDSRVRRAGDFGVGWTLDIRDVRTQENRALGEGWRGMARWDGSGALEYCVEELRPHIVAVTFADGMVFKFRPTISPGCSTAAPDIVAISFAPLPGTNASLSLPGAAATGILRGGFSSTGGHLDIVATDDGSTLDPERYVLTLEDGRVLTLGKHGGLERVADTNGNVLDVGVTGLAQPGAATVRVDRDPRGRIVQVTDPRGNAISYDYDEAGRLVSVSDRVGATTTYTYSPGDQLVGIRDPQGVEVLRNSYDRDGRLLTQTDAAGRTTGYFHDLEARRERVRDHLGHETVYEYDDRGNVLRTRDAEGRTASFEYGAHDEKTRECNLLGECWTLAYDDRAHLLSRTDPFGQTTRYGYDVRGNVVSMTDQLGRTTSSRYDSRDNLVAYVDVDGATTIYEYDGRGRRTKRRDALGNETFFEYDTRGYVTKEVLPSGRMITYAYDGNGNRLRTTTLRTLEEGGEQAFEKRYEYDAGDRLIRTADPDGVVTSIQYNLLGQRTAVTVPDRGRSVFAYDVMGRLVRTSSEDGTSESRTYDADGRLLTLSEAAGRVTTFQYDPAGRVAKVGMPDVTFTTTYKEGGRTTEAMDRLGQATKYRYEPSGRRIWITDPLGETSVLAFGAFGHIEVTDPRGNETTFTHDEFGRLIEGAHEHAGLLLGAVGDAALFGSTVDATANGTDAAFRRAVLPGLLAVADAEALAKAREEQGDQKPQLGIPGVKACMGSQHQQSSFGGATIRGSCYSTFELGRVFPMLPTPLRDYGTAVPQGDGALRSHQPSLRFFGAGDCRTTGPRLVDIARSVPILRDIYPGLVVPCNHSWSLGS